MNVPHDLPPRPLAVRLAEGAADLAACRSLRHRRFFGGDGLDADPYDARCRHLMIEAEGQLVGTLRYTLAPDAAALARTLTAQSYDLSGWRDTGPTLEIGRFCTASRALDAHVVRAALAGLARAVDAAGVTRMIGCSSFPGADPARHVAGLRLLGQDYARDDGPRALAKAVPLAGAPAPLDRRAALAGLPSLLRSYLGLGAWVGPEAVIDRRMDTLHVFTCVEVARIPAARARALRRLAG